MAYDKGKIFKRAIKLTKQHKLFQAVDLIGLLPISESTFYSYFPSGSEELESIKEEFYLNKTEIKVSLKSKWYRSDNPTLQLALFRLLSTSEEHRLLNQNYIDHTTKGKEMKNDAVTIDTLKEIANKLND